MSQKLYSLLHRETWLTKENFTFFFFSLEFECTCFGEIDAWDSVGTICLYSNRNMP